MFECCYIGFDVDSYINIFRFTRQANSLQYLLFGGTLA